MFGRGQKDLSRDNEFGRQCVVEGFARNLLMVLLLIKTMHTFTKYGNSYSVQVIHMKIWFCLT